MTIQFFTPIFTPKFWYFKSLYTKRSKCQPKDKSFKTQALCKTQVLAGSLLVLTLTLNSANAGEVSVSNYPLYLLSQAVTQGKNDAEVLLRAGDVGHHGSLSPTKLKQVKDSQFVVWFGRELEQNLVNTLENSPNAITLFDFKSFHKKPLRDVDGKVIVGSFDPHIWLDPNNAKAIVAALTSIHSTAHPENKAFYEQNAKQFYQKMDKLSTQYKSKPSTPYWAYHDAFQYIEGALSLKFAGALTPDHHLSPKVSRFKVLLISGLLILPALSARLFASSPKTMALIAIFIGQLGVTVGLWGSVWLDIQTGLAIVLVLAGVFFISFIVKKRLAKN